MSRRTRREGMAVADQQRGRARRIAVKPEPLLGPTAHDYADAFEIRLRQPDARSAEQWARSALEDSPWPVRWTVILAHRLVLRFQLAPPAATGHVLGIPIHSSRPDVIHLEATGPLLRAAIILRTVETTSLTVTTFGFYRRPTAARVIWAVVGPLHRRIAPYLLECAADSTCRPAVAPASP